jgi:hypothetical protein
MHQAPYCRSSLLHQLLLVLVRLLLLLASALLQQRVQAATTIWAVCVQVEAAIATPCFASAQHAASLHLEYLLSAVSAAAAAAVAAVFVAASSVAPCCVSAQYVLQLQQDASLRLLLQ